MGKDNEMRIPCAVYPDLDCPSNCPGHSKMEESIREVKKTISFITGEPEDEVEIDSELLADGIKDLQSQGGIPAPDLVNDCIRKLS